MTQLIAVICDSGKSVITVSDRMVSTADMTLTFEHEDRKAHKITDNSVVLIAGTMHEPDLIGDARKRSKGKETVRDIADVFKEVYQELRTSQIEDQILKPIGFKSFDQYYRNQKLLHDQLVIKISREIDQFEVGLNLLLAGVDHEGHVLRISDPGIWASSDNLGYCSIGMGQRHADNVFALYRYSRGISQNEALYIAFEAKKKAEMAGGVGHETDILVITDKGIKEIDENCKKQLEEIYDEGEENRGQRKFDDRIRQFKI